MDWKNDPAYYGKILTGRYSQPLKERVAQCISGYREFEATGNPAICYVAAWHEKDRIIWYEFAGRRFAELLGCKSSRVAEVFRYSVIERRVYRYQAEEPGINKKVIHQPELTSFRKELRETLIFGSLAGFCESGGSSKIYAPLILRPLEPCTLSTNEATRTGGRGAHSFDQLLRKIVLTRFPENWIWDLSIGRLPGTFRGPGAVSRLDDQFHPPVFRPSVFCRIGGYRSIRSVAERSQAFRVDAVRRG